MDKVKQVLHPREGLALANKDTDIKTAHTHPNAATEAALGTEDNVTGTARRDPDPDHAAAATAEGQVIHETSNASGKQPRAGHHHPRQPVGATGLPPNHKPRPDGGSAAQEQPGVTGADGAADDAGRIGAESGNNFPGCN